MEFLKIKRQTFIFAFIVGAAVLAGYFYFTRAPESPYEFIIAERGDIIQEVSVTGRVKPSQSVDLAFERGGRVVWISKDIGEKVFSGQGLVQIYNDDIVAQLAEAEANSNAVEASLNELKKGTRPEEIKIQEAEAEKAKTALEESRKDLINKIQDAYTKSDDAVRNKVDQFFTSPRSSNPQLNFTVSDSGLETDIENSRFAIESLLVSWKSSLGQIVVFSDLSLYTYNAKQNLKQVKSFLDKIALGVNSLTASASHSQTTIDGWRSDVSTGRTNINAAVTNLSSSEEDLKTAQSNLLLEENKLALKKAGATAEQIAAQEAKLQSANAKVSNIQAQIAKTIIRSPINGIVTRVDAKVGEIIAPNVSVISVISEKRFKIEADVPEADIAKIQIGQTAKVTLDAYGNDVVFSAKIILIDPAETIIEGVPTYKTTLQFADDDKKIKPGMTANLDIATGFRENVISIPQRAIIERDGEKIARVLNGDGIIEERKIKTGLRSSFGEVEILAGINEGDKVIIFIKD